MSSTVFLKSRKIPKLYVWGCPAAANENESHYRPPSKDHATFTFGFSGEKQKLAGKIVKYYQKIICSRGFHSPARYERMLSSAGGLALGSN